MLLLLLETNQPINHEDTTKILEVIKFEKDTNPPKVDVLGNPTHQFSNTEHNETSSSQIVLLQPEVPPQKPGIIDYLYDSQPILRFNSYGEFKRALNDYESQTITKFILRNQSKQFTAPGR